MCGIVGVIRLREPNGVNRQILEKMTETLSHRGPDDSGYFINEWIALGHRRLSIIDLNTGHQPLWDVEDSLCTVFNGEIYNYREIRDFLLSRGYNFRTSSDTEVLLNSYKMWGVKCLERFVGMFAFVLYDRTRERCWIVRDRLGIKPLYYHETPNSVVVASEPKAIMAMPEFQATLNKQAVTSYLSYRYVVGDETLLQGIRSLSPGTFLDIDMKSGKIDEIKYWDVPVVPSAARKRPDPDEAIRDIRETLDSAVQYRMIADVPVGAYLSGGLDSSIVVSIMTKSQTAVVSTFSISFDEKEYDESEYASAVAKHCQTDHHVIRMHEEEYWEALPLVMQYKDGPLSVPNEVPLYLMSKELKNYVTVVLSGEGADELFGGYGRIFRHPFAQMRNRVLAGVADERGIGRSLHVPGGQEPAVDELRSFLDAYAYIDKRSTLSLLSTELRNDIGQDVQRESFFRGLFKQIGDLSYEDKILWIFQKVHLLGLLQRLDTTTMGASVEGRVPFVDHRLVEKVNALPFDYKIRWNSEEDFVRATFEPVEKISEILDEPKWLLRRAFQQDLPKEILDRRKIGFPVPLSGWLKGSFFTNECRRLRDGACVQLGVLDAEGITSLVDQTMKGGARNREALQLWMIVNLELWLRKTF